MDSGPARPDSRLSSTTTRFLVILFICCLTIEVSFVLLDLTVNWLRYSSSSAIRRMFNITREDGMATLFAVIQTLAAGLTCWIIWLLGRKHPYKSGTYRVGWFVLALFFTYMAIDDGALVHERLGTAYRKEIATGPLPSYGWQMVVAPFFILMGGVVFAFLWTVDRRPVSRLLLLAGLGSLAVAMGIDYVEGTPDGHEFFARLFAMDKKTVTHFAKAGEEFIEMLGITLLWILLLRNLFLLLLTLRITLSNGRLQVEYVQ